jgi:hypothetical protein
LPHIFVQPADLGSKAARLDTAMPWQKPFVPRSQNASAACSPVVAPSILRPPVKKDVEKFKDALNRNAAIPGVTRRRDTRLPPLVGLYLGWRGLTATAEPLKTSLWPAPQRRKAVGRNSLFDTMEAIIRAAKPDPDDRTRLILVGHSFGARVLENATDGVDEAEAREGPCGCGNDRWRSRRAHAARRRRSIWIGFINAATQASISENAIERLRANETVFYPPGGSVESCTDDPLGDRRPECRPIPLYFAVSSTGDLPTRYLLPVANLLLPSGPGPWRLKSAAFSGGLQSHVVVEVPCLPLFPIGVHPKAIENCASR